jgi:hypothetical protein
MRLQERNRRAIATGALVFSVAGTLIVASIFSRQFFEGPSRPPPPKHPQPLPGAATRNLYRVAALQGPVEVLHNGQWYVAQAGDLLPLSDVIRTPKGSRALLRRGGVEIEVREEVDIRLEKVASDTAASFDLLRGTVAASVDNEQEQVEIIGGGARAVNRGAARFVFELGPNGQVVLGTAKGTALFEAQGKEVAVPAGHESVALPGEEPSQPERIPEELLLSVIWPELEHSATNVQVAGKTRANSRVKINGVEVRVQPDGRFAEAIPLVVGPNKVEVQAQDVLGNKKAVNKVIRRNPPTPTLEATEEELWKK